MIQEFAAYPDWKAPAEDSRFLIWPEPAKILSDTLENHERLARWDSPFGALRRKQREMLKLCEDCTTIATGHQTELYHPGVWVKDALANALARKMSGRAWHFAVDTDSPKHLHLRWPGGSMAVTDDPEIGTGAWSGLLDAPSPVYLKSVQEAIGAASGDWDFAPMVEAFLGIASKGSGNLSAVAPGVGEALIATAAALAVAIPATFGYNIFASRLNRFDSKMERFGTAVIALLVREGRI